jgi:hypothetical protein
MVDLQKLFRNSEVTVNTSTRALLKSERLFDSARGNREREIAAVVHALRDQACVLGLGISALQYPDDSAEERRRHLAVLEGVVEEMNHEFQRLDHWLVQVGYKQTLAEPPGAAHNRRIKRHSVRP